MNEPKRPTHPFQIIGGNVALMLAYTIYLLVLNKNPTGSVMALDAICVAIQFSTCVALWLEEENEIWLLSGLLVVVIGIGALYSIPQAFLR